MQGTDRIRDVDLLGIGNGMGHPYALSCHQLVRRAPALDIGLHAVFELVGKFEASSAKELYSVIVGRVVGGRDDDAAIVVSAGGDKGDGRGRNDPSKKDVSPTRHNARAERSLEHPPASAGVPADDNTAPQKTDGGPSKIERKFRGQSLVGNPSHAVGTEQAIGHLRPP